jgi:glutaredoxin-like YruB-family protein
MGVKIKVYTMEGCPHCAGVKDYLREKGVEFEERDVLADDQAMAEFRELGFRGTPVTLIGDVAIVGFDRERLDTTLAAAG